jgi:cyclopropane fatty-acyl-phospholipid synthase-like methyltransferase
MNNWIKKIKEEKNYKRFVGDSLKYEKIGEILFNVLIENGLNKKHSILDIGCGSLRLGKKLIPYLNKNKYYGIEPEKWLLEESLKNEFDEKIIEKKCPLFSYNNNFELTIFKKNFDYIIANSIFIHAAKYQIEKCIEETSKCLKKNGIFIFNFFEGLKDNNNSSWIYPGAIKYTTKYIFKLLKKHKFCFNKMNIKYPGRQKWIIAKLEKKEND